MQKKSLKILEWSIIGFLVLVLGISSSLFYYQNTYSTKIYKNVSVGDLNLSGLTKKQAINLLDKKFYSFADQEVSLVSDGKVIKTKIADTGLTIDSTSIVNNCYAVGRDSSFVKQLYESATTVFKDNNLQIEPKIDEKKFDDFQKIAVGQLTLEPKDAQLVINNGQIEKTVGTNGQTVDATALADQIINLDKNTDKKIVLTTKTVTPSVTLDNYADAEQQAESILSKNLVLTYTDKTYTPTRQEIGLWIQFSNANGKISASLNDDNIKAYLNKIANNFEIQKKDKKINASDNSVLDAGQQGLYLDRTNALSQIKTQIYAATPGQIALTTYTQDPAEVKVFPAEGLVPGRFEGKYVDVDLTLQKLCMVDGQNVVECFPISSGKPGMPTPTGTYPISEKSPRHWSAEYSMWLPFWERFIDAGYGLHELPETDTWKETSAHLGTPVSHGCVRLGVGPAETVYNWTEIGTIVFVHK